MRQANVAPAPERAGVGLWGFVAAGLALAWLTPAIAGAQAPPARDVVSVTTGDAGRVPTGAYLRMHHPLTLLDLCRAVKAGTESAARVAPMVGGAGVLNALLSRDLDALMEQLTAPRAADSPLARQSTWSLILSQAGAAPPPPADLPVEVSFGDVPPGDEPVRTIRVTASGDGAILTSLPTDAPFQIVSISTSDGTVLPPPARQRGPQPPVFGESTTREEPPWQLPVQAGQDVDVVVKVPAGTPIPPEGLESVLTVEGTWGAFSQGVSLTADPPLVLDTLSIYAAIDPIAPVVDPLSAVTPLVRFDNPSNVVVKGTISLQSGPSGLTMRTFSFVAPPGASSRVVQLTFDGESPAATHYVQHEALLRIAYTSTPVGYRGELTKSVRYEVLPAAKAWKAVQNGLIDCTTSLTAYSDGDVNAEAECKNRNGPLGGQAVLRTYIGNTSVWQFRFDVPPNHILAQRLKVLSVFVPSQWKFILQQPLNVKAEKCVGFCG